jgi:hypothetical protein
MVLLIGWNLSAIRAVDWCKIAEIEFRFLRI